MKEELLKCFNKDGSEVEPKTRGEVHKKPLTIWHGVVGIWICNSGGKILCTKRSPNCEGNPDKWQTYLGGHVLANQTFGETAVKELYEEVGLTIKESDLHLTLSDKREDCMHFYKMYALLIEEADSNKLKFIDAEISEYKWFSFEEYTSSKNYNPENWCNNMTKEQYGALVI